MIDRTAIINACVKEIRTSENPKGSNMTKYGAWYGMNGSAWCAMFVAYIFDQCGHRLNINAGFKGFHYVPTLHQMAKKNGWFTDKPKPGDIVLFDFKPSDGKEFAQHVGILGAINTDGTYMCYEGNTSSDEIGSQDNGDGVYYKRRKKAFILGFVDIDKMLK